MDPFTLLAGGAAIAKAGAGIAQGVGTARAAKKMMLTDAEKRELADLEARQRRGELGLTEEQRGGLEARFLQEQAGATRELQTQGLQQAAARGGGVSGRELFLQEQARAGAQTGMRVQQGQVLAEAERAAAQAEAQRIEAMRQQQKAAEAQRAQGIAQAVSGGLAGAADVGMQAAAIKEQRAQAEAALVAQQFAVDEAVRRLASPGAITGGGLIPAAPRR